MERDIDQAGAERLICAIVKQARDDVLFYSPGCQVREDAEVFFQSAWFELLTDIDGSPILDDLRRHYDKKHKRKE